MKTLKKVAPTSMMLRGAFHHGEGIGKKHSETLRSVLLLLAFAVVIIGLVEVVTSYYEHAASIEKANEYVAACNERIQKCNNLIRSCGVRPIELNSSEYFNLTGGGWLND